MIAIRLEAAADVAGIRAVHVASFPTAAEADLVEALRAAGRLSVSLVAVEDGTIVGHAAISAVTAAGTPPGAGLAPVAVLPVFRRRGVAAALVEAALACSRELGFSWAVVLGNPAYYGRFGFLPASEHGLSDEYGGGNCFQVMELAPGGIPAGAGLVRYAPEFAGF